MWFLLLAILGGGATEASAQAESAQVKYEATQVTTANKIDFSGKTKYAIQAVHAGGQYDLSSVLKNRFLKYDYVNGGLTYVMIGYPSNAASTTNSGYTSVTDICKNMGDKGDGDKYTFTFDGNANEFTVKNCTDGYLWGNNSTKNSTKNRPIGKGQTSTIKVKLYEQKDGEFTLETNGNPYRHTNTSNTGGSAYVSYGKVTNPNVLYFKIYEIAKIAETKTQATFKYYQEKSKVPYASVTKEVKSGNTIAGLAEVPTYLKADYYNIEENQEESPVGGGNEAEAGKTYSVRTSYPNDLPFVIDGTTYFSLGSNINTALKATSVPAGDIEFAKYAVKMSGDCINGYLLQYKNNNYLKNTGSEVSKVEEAGKFDIEKSEDNWYLKSHQADGQYLIINTNGTVSFTPSIEAATALKNLSDEQAYNYINTNCPAGHYVGSYSKDQAGTISFAQILKGEGKISISADKYYLFEEAEDDTYFLTSKESTQHMSDLHYTYQVSGMAEVTFSSLWQWKNNMIVNANTGKHLDWQASLSDENTTSYRSMVENHDDYKQAFTIELDTHLGDTYYLKQTGKTAIKSINSKPGTNAGYWFIREADAFSIPLHAVDEKSYATMYAPVKLVQDAEDKTIIYTGNVNGNGSLHLEEWEGGVIPANTPLVLVNEEGAESARFLISYDEPAREVTPDDNWTGTNIKFQFTGDERNNYRLFGFNSAFGVGFFKPKATGNIPANRGYISNLPYQTIGLQFPDGTTTSIDAAILNGNTTAEDTPIYDISGRRLMQPTRGQFYIRNGQKFIAQ